MFSSMHLCIPLHVGLFHIKNVSPLGQRPHPLSCIPQCVPHALSWDGLSRSLPHTHGLHSVAWCSPRTKEGGRGWSWAGRAMGLQEHECCAVAVDGSLPKAFFYFIFCIAAIRNTSGQKTKQSSFFFPFPSSQDMVTLLWEAETSEKASCWNGFLINTAGCLPSSLKSLQPTAWHCAYVFLPGYIQTLAVLATKVFQVSLA